MPANQEHVHLAWPLWSDLRVIPTHGEFCSLVRPLAIFARSCLVDLIRMTTSVGNNSVFRSFFEKQKLTGPNFIDWSMFEREKLSRNNFNDWFRQLKLVLRVEKKMYVIEQPLPAAPAADSQAQVLSQWNAVYDAYNEVACLILGSMTPELHRQFENSSPYDMIKELKSMFEKQARMKNYVELERLGYVLPQDLTIGLILNGLTSDFVGFKANKKSLNAKGKGKANGKGKDKQVYIPKPKNPKPSTKEHPAKDDTCHCKEVGHWKRNCHVYLAEFLKKKKQVGSASSSGVFRIELFDFPNKSWVHDTGCDNSHTKRAKHNLDSTYLWNCRLAHISKKCIEKLQQEGLLKSTDDESFNECVSCLSGKMTRKSFPHRPERATNLLGIIHYLMCEGPHLDMCHAQAYSSLHITTSERINRTLLDMVRSMMNLTTLSLSFWDYALESATRILNIVSNKPRRFDKTPYELWYGKVPNLSYLKVWGCEALVKRDTPDKLQQKSVKCIFIGYLKEIMGYYLLSIENKIVFASMLSSLFEKNLHNSRVSVRAMDLDEIQDERYITYEITSEFPKEG
ncbi:retrotransposon protein, putative, ty1-copia subclass [Tanacetum coccineum]